VRITAEGQMTIPDSNPPDIGAHAAIAGYRLMACGAARYRNYFQEPSLIAPS
jgi:hypothetical protein